MAECDRPHSSAGRCAPPSSADVGSEEGKWVGVCVAIWIVVALVIWLIRTCTNRERRQRALRNIRCFGKTEEVPPPEVNAIQEVGAPPMYYTLWPPPSYEEALQGMEIIPANKTTGGANSLDRHGATSRDISRPQINNDEIVEGYNTSQSRNHSVSEIQIQEQTSEPGCSRTAQCSCGTLTPPSDCMTVDVTTCVVSCENESVINIENVNNACAVKMGMESHECGICDSCIDRNIGGVSSVERNMETCVARTISTRVLFVETNMGTCGSSGERNMGTCDSSAERNMGTCDSSAERNIDTLVEKNTETCVERNVETYVFYCKRNTGTCLVMNCDCCVERNIGTCVTCVERNNATCAERGCSACIERSNGHICATICNSCSQAGEMTDNIAGARSDVQVTEVEEEFRENGDEISVANKYETMTR